MVGGFMEWHDLFYILTQLYNYCIGHKLSGGQCSFKGTMRGTVVLIWARYHDGLNLNGIQKAGEKRQACIFKVKSMQFPGNYMRKRVVGGGGGTMRFSV